jgi:sortase (surface protein transpeptidase)
MAAGGRIAILAALALLVAATPSGDQTAQQAAGRLRATVEPAKPPIVDSFRSTRTYQAVPVPVRLRIPAVHLDTPLQRLHRQTDGTVAVPDSPGTAGWYAEGARPGQPGPAVILGHVDSVNGPAVFFRLTELSPGADVQVDREDGSSVSFRVTGVSRVPKTRFPTDLVYSPTLQPSLQLVTCGGSFDHRARSYQDNVIVYTVPT